MSDSQKIEFLRRSRSGNFAVDKPQVEEASVVEPFVAESELDMYQKRLIQVILERLEK